MKHTTTALVQMKNIDFFCSILLAKIAVVLVREMIYEGRRRYDLLQKACILKVWK